MPTMSAKKERKEKKKLAKAAAAEASSTGHAEAWLEDGALCGMTQITVERSEEAAAAARSKLKGSPWGRQASAKLMGVRTLFSRVDSNCEAFAKRMQAEDLDPAEIARLAEPLAAEVTRLMAVAGTPSSAAASGYALVLVSDVTHFPFLYLANARLELALRLGSGDRRKLHAEDKRTELLRGACVTATDGLKIRELRRLAPDRYKEPAEVDARHTLEYFCVRGKAHDALGETTEALRDLRAAVAGLRLGGLDFNEIYNYDTLHDLLGVMAKSKMGAPRPHYTDAERCKIYKDLGLRQYAPANYKCTRCDKRPTPGYPLRQCARCTAWYCSKECQVADWPEHKSSGCKRVREKRTEVRAVLSDRDGQRFMQRFRERGFFVISQVSGPTVVLRDNDTGRFFDSITDQNIDFGIDP